NSRIILTGQLQTQPVVLDALAPQIIALFIRSRPRLLVAYDREMFLLAEIEVLLKKAACKRHAFDDAHLIDVEDGKRDGQILTFDRIINFLAAGQELINIRLQEDEPIRV